MTPPLQIAPGESTDLPRARIKADTPQITIRATLAGLAIGSIVLVSNFQFGLQTGWVSMMSLPAALLGFALFKLFPVASDFSDVENVYVQSVAVAVGTGPLAYGLIGIVPAMEKFMTAAESGLGRVIHFTLGDLVLWSLGLGLFGVFFAIPLRKQVIIKEKLPFPSGSATATLIAVLHDSEMDPDSDNGNTEPLQLASVPGPDLDQGSDLVFGQSYSAKMISLVSTFGVSALYTLAAFFFPILKQIPIFGHRASNIYQWNFQPSPAYIGQGIIMGLPTVSYMMFGAILGWGVLAPSVQYLGWAPGKIDDWVNGSQGWVLWISLSVMISDSLVSFCVVVATSLYGRLNRDPAKTRYMALTDGSYDSFDESPDNRKLDIGSSADIPERYLVGPKVTLAGIAVSSLICVIAVRAVFGSIVPYYAIFVAIILAMLFSILGVRALGETDLNPVSGIGKLSQLIFSLIIPRDHPAKILINLVAGGIAEAGAQQAGDLMQDLKTGHLIGASPKAQFVAQLIGTIFSVGLSSVMYKVYNAVYTIPSDSFRIPTAIIWIDCARLFSGEGLPPHAVSFSIVFGLMFGLVSLTKNLLPKSSQYHRYLVYLPNGVAVGIGMYNIPSFTLARFIGGTIAYYWLKSVPAQDMPASKSSMIIFSSGLVLGEGLLSGVTMLLTSLGVPHY